MQWYVVIKAFLVVWSTFGPYHSKEECQTRLTEMYNEGMARYAAGERVTFLGKTVTPESVRMSCKLK